MYLTGNPIGPDGSTDPRDLSDNAQIADVIVNDTDRLEVDSRLGEPLVTLAGYGAKFYAFLSASGFETPVLTYTDGVPLQVDRPTQLLERASAPGTMYSIKLPSVFPVILSGTWATDEPLLVVRADQALRQDLADATDPVKGAGMVGYVSNIPGSAPASVKDALRNIENYADAPVFRSAAELADYANPRENRLYSAALGDGVKHYNWVPGSTIPVDLNRYTVLGSNIASGRFVQVEGADPIYVLLMGQSNAVGADPATTGSYFPVNPNVQAWDEISSQWVVPAPGQEPFNPSGSYNAGVAFCNRLTEETGRQVRLILIADGSTPIAAWTGSAGNRTISSGNRPKYVEMQTALASIDLGRPVDIFMWIQGEADAEKGIDYYQNEFKYLITEMTEQGYLDGIDTPILASQLSMGNSQQGQGLYYPTVWASANVYSLLHIGDNRLQVVNSYGCASNMDGAPFFAYTHFSDQGLDMLGRDRFWGAYQQAKNGWQQPLDYGLERLRSEVGIAMMHEHTMARVTTANSPFLIRDGLMGGVIEMDPGTVASLPDFTNSLWSASMQLFRGWVIRFKITAPGSFTLSLPRGVDGTGWLVPTGAIYDNETLNLVITPQVPEYLRATYKARWNGELWEVSRETA